MHTLHIHAYLIGRTGRSGNRKKTGEVISFLTYDEMKRLQSWQVPLGITLEIAFD